VKLSPALVAANRQSAACGDVSFSPSKLVAVVSPQRRPQSEKKVYKHVSVKQVLSSEWTMCGNKMPTRCNRGFYCRSYFLLNMFRAPVCPSSGAQEYYTVVADCGISCCGFQVAGLVWS